MMHELLSTALRRATDALRGDDAEAASAALRDAAAACESALRQGLGLEGGDARTLRPLHAECCAASDATRRRLSEAIATFGLACRASGAYRR